MLKQIDKEDTFFIKFKFLEEIQKCRVEYMEDQRLKEEEVITAQKPLYACATECRMSKNGRCCQVCCALV